MHGHRSVLEPSRTLTLAEKGGREPEVIVAHPSFRLIGTMNPGGDFGKKELSPALSNRFTSIWVPPIDDVSEMKSILKSRLEEAAHLAVPLITDFVSFYKDKLAQYCRQRISLRDLLTWVEFVNAMTPALGPLLAYTHGACVTLLDGIGLGLGLSEPVSELRC